MNNATVLRSCWFVSTSSMILCWDMCQHPAGFANSVPVCLLVACPEKSHQVICADLFELPGEISLLDKGADDG